MTYKCGKKGEETHIAREQERIKGMETRSYI